MPAQALALEAGPTVPAGFVPRQADNDAQFLALWMHGKAATSKREYKRETTAFLDHVAKPLRWITLGDLQAYSDSLEGLADATRARIISILKSLFSFAQKIGYVQFNIGAAMTTPKIKNRLAERILSYEEVLRIIVAAKSGRDKTLLRFLFATGARASEACGLRWRDLATDTAGVVCTIHGKGGRTRHVRLPAGLGREVLALRRPDDGQDAPVFRSRLGGALDPSALWRIVRNAARSAGIDKDASPHFLRHAHASTALDRGCKVHVLQASLGHSSLATTSRYVHVRPGESSSAFVGIE